MQSIRMEDHYAVRSDTSGMVVGKLRRERALAVCPTLQEHMRCLTLGSARGVESADSSRALEVVGCYDTEVYVTAGGEGTEFASKVP